MDLPIWLKAIIIVFLVGLLILIISISIKKYYATRASLNTPENNAAIAAAQIARFEPRYLGREPLPALTVGQGLAEDEKALINYNILGCRVAGYLGPLESGVFAEDDAVRIAMRAGCRVFLLPIDTIEKSGAPLLVVRTANGDKISNNVGSIAKVAAAIDKYAPKGAQADPIIVMLYFQSMPSANPYAPESIKYMMAVANELAPLKRRHLGLTSEGDYRRQKMADTLFLRNREDFDGKVIVLTNVDTKGFREGVLPTTEGLPKINAANDLDLWVHARMYSETTKGLGMTSVPEDAKVNVPRLETPAYYLNIPDDRLPGVIAKSKVEWSTSMNKAPDATAPTPATLKVLLDKVGTSCIMADVFSEDSKGLDAGIFSESYFAKSGFRLKPAELRYRRPSPIPLTAPNKQLDARGGRVQAPTL